MGINVDDLLAGPRGRILCMAVAQRLDDAVWPAWLEAAWHPSDNSRLRDLVRALEAVDVEAVREWQSPAAFVDPVDDTVTSAMYWQAPHDTDLVTAHGAVMSALRSVADAIAAAPAAAWWTSPVDLDVLRYTSWPDEGHRGVLPGPGAAERLTRWRTETLADDRDAARSRPADPAAPWSGRWWSTPAMAGLWTTTRPLAGLGSVELVWQEDSAGLRNAAVWVVAPARAPKVYEIDGPDAWSGLVDRYPLDVTNGRRHDWYRTTGRTGVWLIPDWLAVAADWDAVHVSIAGYLTTATRALPLGDHRSATLLAGWNPDQTWWLTDTLTPDPPPEMWERRDAEDSRLAWRRSG